MNTKFLVDISAIFVAAMALSVSYCSMQNDNEQTRLSVHPELSLHFDRLPILSRSGLFIKNKGIGPARIKCIEILVKGEKIKRIGDRHYMDSAFVNANAPTAIPFEDLQADDMISAGETLPVMFVVKDKYKDHIPKMKKTLSNLEIAIAYESIYQERAVTTYPRSFSRSYEQVCEAFEEFYKT